MPTREFLIRIALPRWTRRQSLVAVTLLLGIGALVYAATPLNLYIPQKNDPLKASNIAQNFTDIQTAVNNLQMDVAALQGQGSVCGLTIGTYTGGQVGGYTGAAKLRAAVCPANAAVPHMCTASDLSRFLQLGGVLTKTGWYSGYVNARLGGVLNNDDCSGWTDSSNTHLAFTTAPSSYDYCNVAYQVLCCK